MCFVGVAVGVGVDQCVDFHGCLALGETPFLKNQKSPCEDG